MRKTPALLKRLFLPGSLRGGRLQPGAGRPPVIVLGGGANALSIARSLGRYGVKVYAINLPTEHIRHSRYAEWIPLPDGENYQEIWRDYLLGPSSAHLWGSVLLGASDAALELIAQNRAALLERFILDDSNPEAQLCMLNKLCTYRAAVDAGVPTPRFWLVNGAKEVEQLKSSLVFPLLVKPQRSYLFEERFGRKFFVAKDFDHVADAVRVAGAAGIQVLLMELIPGPDDRLCSYYTYLDERGEPLFDFTKRVIRRFPPGEGMACYHITDQVPELRSLALRLFRQVGLRGLANVEFKYDERDGQLKLIECNARFTAANCLVAESGFDLARFVYNRLVGLPQEPLTTYRSGLRLWYPIEDFRAYRVLHARGELSFPRWVRSLLHWQKFPFFAWEDPAPSFVDLYRRARKKLPWQKK